MTRPGHSLETVAPRDCLGPEARIDVRGIDSGAEPQFLPLVGKTVNPANPIGSIELPPTEAILAKDGTDGRKMPKQSRPPRNAGYGLGELFPKGFPTPRLSCGGLRDSYPVAPQTWTRAKFSGGRQGQDDNIGRVGKQVCNSTPQGQRVSQSYF